MAVTVEVKPVVTEIFITGTNTSINISSGITPLAWGSILGDIANQSDLQSELGGKLDKTSEIQELQVVSALPGTPDPNTIYFITT